MKTVKFNIKFEEELSLVKYRKEFYKLAPDEELKSLF